MNPSNAGSENSANVMTVVAEVHERPKQFKNATSNQEVAPCPPSDGATKKDHAVISTANVKESPRTETQQLTKNNDGDAENAEQGSIAESLEASEYGSCVLELELAINNEEGAKPPPAPKAEEKKAEEKKPEEMEYERPVTPTCIEDCCRVFGCFPC